MTIAMLTARTADIPSGNSGAPLDGTIWKDPWKGIPGPPDAFIQQVTTWYSPTCEVEPVPGAPLGGRNAPPTQAEKSAGMIVGRMGNQAAELGPVQPTTLTPGSLAVESKDPGPPNGTVHTAVPPPGPKKAATGHPKPGKCWQAYVAPEGVMTAVKNC